MEGVAYATRSRFPREESLAVLAGGHVGEDGAGSAGDSANVAKQLDEATTLLGGRDQVMYSGEEGVSMV